MREHLSGPSLGVTEHLRLSWGFILTSSENNKHSNSTMSTFILRVTRPCLAPTVSRVSFMWAGRGAVSTTLRAPTPSRRASGVLTIGARPFSSKSEANNGTKHPRLVPVVAVTTTLAFGVYLYKRGRRTIKLDQSGRKGNDGADERLMGAEVRH